MGTKRFYCWRHPILETQRVCSPALSQSPTYRRRRLLAIHYLIRSHAWLNSTRHQCQERNVWLYQFRHGPLTPEPSARLWRRQPSTEEHIACLSFLCNYLQQTPRHILPVTRTLLISNIFPVTRHKMFSMLHDVLQTTLSDVQGDGVSEQTRAVRLG